MLGTVLGGIGLFLLGMVLLTDGIKAAAGESLRGYLARFTGGRISSAVSGAAITAMVQSSTATTLATIGFVSAGMITLTQAIGIVIGANLGSTATGWLVALLGLKLSVGKIALPLVGVGVLLKLLTRDRLADVGLALSGFGLIFVGIDVLQGGMEALAARFDPTTFPRPTLLGRLVLVGVGTLMTVVVQSSGVAVAATLTALHTGSIDLLQAAALVTGQNLGSSLTTAAGALGASSAAKRTAVAHVLFNVVTTAVVFVILPLEVRALELGCGALGVTEPALLLATFHTAFNVIGVAIFLPALGPLVRVVTHLVPEGGPQLTRRLDPVTELGPLALDAAGLTLREVLQEALGAAQDLLGGGGSRQAIVQRLQTVEDALVRTRDFLAKRRGASGKGSAEVERHVALFHVIDHLERLVETCRERSPFLRVRREPAVLEVQDRLWPALAQLREALEQGRAVPVPELQATSQDIAARRREGRPRLIGATARGELDPSRSARVLEAVRWLDRIGYHSWRAAHHLAAADPTSLPGSKLPETPPTAPTDPAPAPEPA